MYETYPKNGGPRMLGEQKATTFAKGSGTVKSEYQQVGSSDRYPTKGSHGPSDRHQSMEKARAPFAKAGGQAMVSASYPSKGQKKFATDAKNKLVSPTSRPPKKA